MIVLAACGCVSVVMLGIAAVAFVARIDNEPSWWVQSILIDAQSSVVIEQAERFENAITTQLTMVRTIEQPQWAVAITPEQANNWLATRLQKTITTHLGDEVWPDEVGRFQLVIEDDQLIVGARLHHRSGTTVVWGIISFELDEAGGLWAQVSSTHLGSAWVPTRLLVEPRIKLGSGYIELGDGRMVEVRGIRVRNGQLELAMQTVVSD